jgi:hypothetical protein
MLKEEGEWITGDRVDYDVGDLVVQPPRYGEWDERLENVLTEHAAAWERLATL